MLEHGGQLRAAVARYGVAREHWIDLSTGINPQGYAPPTVPPEAWQRLPEQDDGLEQTAAAYYGTTGLLPVAGSQAAIQCLPHLRKACRVGVLSPGYAEHAHAWRLAGHLVIPVYADGIDAYLDGLDVLVVMNPNNPTGATFAPERLHGWHLQLAARGGWLVVDEAFADAMPQLSMLSQQMQPGLVVLRSLGKFFGLAGARVGFVAAHNELLDALRERLGPWALTGPSRFVARSALGDADWQRATRARLPKDSGRLSQLLGRHGLAPDGGCALFQWVRRSDAASLHERLAQRGILTRLFASPASLRFGLPEDEAQWERLSIALANLQIESNGRELNNVTSDDITRREMAKKRGLLIVNEHFEPPSNAIMSSAAVSQLSARTVMVQGTTSDAGKSLLVTALCRWLKRQGVNVAPFKPQNMALNSAVTTDGGEIGRAQAAQAQACGLAPHTDMNPVLLKPNSDTGAQVIVHGRAIGNMNALTYHEYKRSAREAVLASHTRLSHRYDAIVVEGAGSPAEINLRAHDIANMGFAEAVDCPVILVADIDRGGVFAHLVGTLELLSDSERARIKGFVINRFRGDLALLQPGLDWLEQRTGKPVLGVLPYLRDLHLDAEDSLSAHSYRQLAGEGDRLRIVVPATPRISNHTDFDPLRVHPQVSLHFVAAGEPIPDADIVILPGSKSVRADLDFLRAQGWEGYLQRHLRYGGKVIGICGGFQMLGKFIRDPLGIEGKPGSSAGFAWLDIETTLAPEKQLRNVRGTLTLGDAEVCGYEIHAGVSTGPGLARPAARLPYGTDGAVSEDGLVLGSYLHGLFDAREACDALLRWAGLPQAQATDYPALREATFERLADAVEQHLDTQCLCELFKLREAACAR